MGILRTKANPPLDLYLSKINRDITPKTLDESRKDSTSLTEFLNERHFIIVDDHFGIEQARQWVEASGIINMMVETCKIINGMVGRTIVDMHSFLPPEPILCCFIYIEGGSEYFMRLEMRGAIPTLNFSERKCRDAVSNDFVRWVHRLADIEPVTITVKLVHEFQEINVSVDQVREWFKYLVSGLDRSYMPSF